MCIYIYIYIYIHKRSHPCQDSWCLLKTDSCSIYGVFDGHGQKGHDVSQFVKARG